MKKITVNINLVKSASYSDPNPFKKKKKSIFTGTVYSV